MPEERYQRLTRDRAEGFIPVGIVTVTRSSLWLGSDHLLLVRRNGYTESYKRFYFRDIQAITLRGTRTRAIWNGVFGSLAGILLVIALSTADWKDATSLIIWCCVLLAFCGIPLLFNTLSGPACTGYIKTAVQTEQIPSLRRVRQSHKAMGSIRKRIVEAQGQLSAEEASARLREAAQGQAVPQSSAVPPVMPPAIS